MSSWARPCFRSPEPCHVSSDGRCPGKRRAFFGPKDQQFEGRAGGRDGAVLIWDARVPTVQDAEFAVTGAMLRIEVRRRFSAWPVHLHSACDKQIHILWLR